MSKKKNAGGKKPPRQPVNILTCWSTLLHLCSMWKFVNYPSFLHRSKNAHSRMATLFKGIPRFNGLWNLDRPSDKYVAMQIQIVSSSLFHIAFSNVPLWVFRVFLHKGGQILVEISSLLQSRLRRRLLLCQCATRLADGTSQGNNKSRCCFLVPFVAMFSSQEIVMYR